MRLFNKIKLKSRHLALIGLVKQYKMRLALGMFCMLVMAASTAASAWMIKPILDDIFVHKNKFMLKLLPMAVIAIYILRGFSMYGQEYLMDYVGQNIIRKLRNMLYNQIMNLPISFFHKEKTGALMSRITYDVNIVKTMVSSAVAGAIRDAFTIVFLTIVIFYRDWKMACFAFLILPLAFIPLVKFGRRVRKVSTGVQENMADLSTFLHETFAGNKVVKAFGMEQFEKKRFADKTLAIFNIELKNVIAKSLSSPVMEFLGGIGISFIIWYGGYQVIKGTSTPGTFFSFMAAVIMLYDPVKKLTKINNSVQEGMAAANRIFDVIEKETDIKEISNPTLIEKKPHCVSFTNVSFSYDSDRVLRNINLHVEPGKVLALVGMSGGGKTTLVNLIPRFFDVTQGAIKIDDMDIKNTSISSLRKQIAIVTQEPILFNDTIRNNIAYGNLNASENKIKEAAKAAYAYDFIQHFPDKFDTITGELGARLSGGEKQRLCIARALLKNAPILILDEATSALDTEAEMLVQKALKNLMKGRTTFVIAHRLSTISHADRIAVIVNGKIVEEGTHQELIKQNGEYNKLYEMQFNIDSKGNKIENAG